MPDPTPDPLQDVPADVRARLAAVTAKLPPGWTLVEVIHDHYGWTARLADESGHAGAEIIVYDPPAENPQHRPPGENDRI